MTQDASKTAPISRSVATSAAVGARSGQPRFRNTSPFCNRARHERPAQRFYFRRSEPGQQVSLLFDTAVEDLDEPLHTTYVALAVLPSGWFTSEMCAAALDCSVLEAESRLMGLAAACLVNYVGPGCYTVHGLLHEHARTMALAHDHDGLVSRYSDRLVNWMSLSVFNADRALVPDRLRVATTDEVSSGGRSFSSASEALDWLELMEPTLVSVIRACSDAGRDEVVVAAAEGLWPYFSERKPMANWLAVTELGVTSARRMVHIPALARLLAQRSVVEASGGHHEDARLTVEDALVAAEQTSDHVLIASVTEFAGSIALMAGDLDRASCYLNCSLKEYADLGLDRAIALQCYLLGKVEHRRGDLGSALSYLEQAASLLRLDDPITRVKVLYHWALVLTDAGEYDQAQDCAAIAARIRTELPLGVDFGDVLALQAQIANALGETEHKETYTAQALDVYDTLGSTRASHLRSEQQTARST